MVSNNDNLDDGNKDSKTKRVRDKWDRLKYVRLIKYTFLCIYECF